MFVCRIVWHVVCVCVVYVVHAVCVCVCVRMCGGPCVCVWGCVFVRVCRRARRVCVGRCARV